MASPEYLALKNHLHNTLGFNREEIKKLIMEVVENTVKDAVRQYLASKNLAHFICQHAKGYNKWARLEDDIRHAYDKALQDAVTKAVNEKFSLDIQLKAQNENKKSV